ncbi:MAG: M3 family metallopeptidase, partial [Bacteroidales bacterium]|nr:M3 family metallopeptidase [Bacteroidales bacterium]
SYIAFMRYADDRELRRQMYMAYNTQGIKDNGSSNIGIVKEIVNHRMQIAQLLGYKDFASYVLKKRMAEDEAHVYGLLNELLNAYMPTAHKEIKELTEFAKEWQGDADFALMPWDVSYYSNKLKEKKFHIDAELLRPYFELDKVKAGIFGLANRLYGIKFERNTEISVYQKDVEVYEVFDADESFLGILYLDFFPRDGKQSGAWTSSFTDQWIDRKTGEDHRPQILISTNFNKPTTTKPALLTFEEMRTFLHEFGHSLHGMLSKVTYQSQSGTSVYWDFVELPSQFMENYAIEKDFLHTFAKHYETGKTIPNEDVQHIIDADNFNVAYACLRQVGFGLIDMAWYTRKTIFEGDVIKFEKEAEKDVLLMPDAENTCMSTQFSHIFCGGYAAGYYSYKWAEVIETDAFSLFKQRGIFDSATAQSFRDNILSKGGTEEPMLLYKRFRGQEPSIDALLIKDGIKHK